MPAVGEHSILACSRGCGRWTRPKRMTQEAAEEIVHRLYGPEADVRVNTGKAVCTSCRNADRKEHAGSSAKANPSRTAVTAIDKDPEHIARGLNRFNAARQARLARGSAQMVLARRGLGE